MRSNITMNVEFLAGTSIEVAIQEAKDLARRLGIAYVKFNFNGVEVSVRQESDVQRAVEAYQTDAKLKYLVA